MYTIEDLKDECSMWRMKLSGDLQFQIRTVEQTQNLADMFMIHALTLEQKLAEKEN